MKNIFIQQKLTKTDLLQLVILISVKWLSNYPARDMKHLARHNKITPP